MAVSVRQFIGGILGGSGGSSETYATIAQLPLAGNAQGSLAFVVENNRLYIWNGVGWFNIALINTNPTITQGPNASYAFATDGAPIVITLAAEDPEGIPIVFSAQVTSGTLGNTAVITQDANVFTITPSTDSDDAGTFSVTFTASDGVNIATAVSSFTLVFTAADTRYNQSILLTTSSENNANNNTFIDSSTNNFAITRVGNTTQGTFSPHSPAGWSGYFDGAGDYLDIVDSLKTNDLAQTTTFTVEAWIYVTGGSTVRRYICSSRPHAANQGFEVAVLENTNTVTLIYTGVTGVASVTPMPFNVWTHVAFVRSGTTMSVYINGQLDATNASMTNGAATATNTFRIGATQDSGGLRSFFGNISNLRIVKGTALYTANFTPPVEPLTATAGTSLLTLQDNRFIDRSTNNFVITRNGDVRVTPFSPFLPTVQYDPATHGGSAYFDGVGDYLAAPSAGVLNFGTDDFTIEAWVYSTNVTNTAMVLSNDGPSRNIGNISFFIRSNGSGFGIQRVTTTAGAAESIQTSDPGSVLANVWNHFAATKVGTTIRLFLNGVLVSTQTSASSSWGNEANPVQIGRRAITGFEAYITGYISNLRVVKGTALYTTNFTPPAAPATAVAGTSLLLNFTNAAIFDETGKIVLETVGDARTSAAVVKYGDTSMSFDGTGDYLLVPSDPVFDFSGDFTIEMWINFTNVNSTWQSIVSRAYGIAGGWRLYKNDSNNQLRWYSTLTSVVLTTGSTLANNTWSHIAVVRNSGTVAIYIDGVNRGSAVNATNYTPGNYAIEIGQGVVTSAFPMTGHISDLRITNGHARYTANFTPPTARLGYFNAE